MSRLVLALDFDATLAHHDRGSFNLQSAGDPIVDPHGFSSLEFIRKLHTAGYELWIYTVRASQPDGDVAVLRWLRQNGVDDLIEGITATKHGFFHRFIDDKAIPFHGSYGEVLTALGLTSPAEPQEYWVVGNVIDSFYGSWELQGLYSTEDEAGRRCEGPTWFIMPLELGARIDTKTITNPRAYYPLAEDSVA